MFTEEPVDTNADNGDSSDAEYNSVDSETCFQPVEEFLETISSFRKKHEQNFSKSFYVCLLGLFIVYFVYAVYYNLSEFGNLQAIADLIGVTATAVILAAYVFLSKRFGDQIQKIVFEPLAKFGTRHRTFVRV